MINEIFSKRFQELEALYGKLRFQPNSGGRSGTHVETGEWKRWATSAQNLILAVFGVLACAALEDALKRYAAISGIDVTEKSMQDIVNALKGKGLVVGAQKSLLDTMPRIRNIALHADWEKLSEPDVNSVIGFVEQFLLSKFGGG